MSDVIQFSQFSSLGVTISQKTTHKVEADKGGFGQLLQAFSAGDSKKIAEKNTDVLLAGNYAKDFVDVLLEHFEALQRGEGFSSYAEYGFTSEFTSVFGTHGPLINFIQETTISLNLSAEQNLALQQIAVNNKDATRSRECIDKIAAELKAAGITA